MKGDAKRARVWARHAPDLCGRAGPCRQARCYKRKRMSEKMPGSASGPQPEDSSLQDLLAATQMRYDEPHDWVQDLKNPRNRSTAAFHSKGMGVPGCP